jgi:biopolymer transport protein TolQ
MSITLASMGVFFSAYSQSDFFGKLIFIGLYSLSIICWAVLIHRVWITKKVKKVAEDFREAVEQNKQTLLSLDLGGLPQPHSKQMPHPFGEIFLSTKEKALEILNKNHYFATKQKLSPAVYLSASDISLVETQALTTASYQAKLLEKNLFVLSTIVTLAPFLGLLGTVWGILVTFADLHAGAGSNSNAVILGGLSTALATTVLGLVIAIPALIAHSYLKNTARDLSFDMEDFCYQILSTIELQYKKADAS